MSEHPEWVEVIGGALFLLLLIIGSHHTVQHGLPLARSAIAFFSSPNTITISITRDMMASAAVGSVLTHAVYWRYNIGDFDE